MSERKPKPTRWLYLLALLIPVFACVGTILLVYRTVPKLPGALETMGIQNLTKVIVPGSEEIYFPKARAYAVYYEYRSDIESVHYVRGKYPPHLDCQLESKASGNGIELVGNYIEGNMYATQNQERVGVLINSITIDQPGIYKFSCQYPDGRTDPEIVLAVGPNMIYEFFNIAVKPIAVMILGVPIFVCTSTISILIIGFVAYKHNRSKNILATGNE